MSLTGTGVTGLGANGVVPAGSTWSALGSQILSQGGTGTPTSFTGYVFGIANFPYAHPVSFVADASFSGKFTAGGPALVLPNPAQTSRSTTFTAAGGVESLGH
jgi:hypothetical protein